MSLYKTHVKKISISADKKTKQKDYLPQGELPIIDQGHDLIGGYTDDVSKQISCNLPVIVFGDHTKAVKYINFSFGAGADGIKILEPKEDVKPLYLYYRTIYLTYKIEDKGYARHYQYIEKAEVSIPPISEQERIVARIEELFSELDKAVETLKTTKEQLKVYRQAVYSSVFDKSMPIKPITNYFEITGGLTKNSKRNTFPQKMLYLRVANVYYNKLDLTEVKEIGVKESEIEKSLLQTGDLLFVEGNGSKSQIGRVAMWDGSIERCLHQNHLIKGRGNGDMLPKYALFYLISAGGRKQIVDVAKSTSGLYTLSTNKVKNLLVPYCDLEKQRKILAEIESRLSVCDSIEQTVNTALQQAEAMRQSILKQAFEGRLL
jgi:type I restriction enzyme S subunit